MYFLKCFFVVVVTFLWLASANRLFFKLFEITGNGLTGELLIFPFNRF